MGFVGIFWKKNIWKAYLPKPSIVGQIVSDILGLFCSDDSIQILLNLIWFLMLWPESNLEGFVWSHQSITALISQRQWDLPWNAIFWQIYIGLLGIVLSWNTSKNPIVSQVNFLWRHTLGLYRYKYYWALYKTFLFWMVCACVFPFQINFKCKPTFREIHPKGTHEVKT